MPDTQLYQSPIDKFLKTQSPKRRRDVKAACKLIREFTAEGVTVAFAEGQTRSGAFDFSISHEMVRHLKQLESCIDAAAAAK